MAKLVTQAHINTYQTTITQVRKDLGRAILIHLKPTEIDCPWCILDPINDKSSGLEESGMDWTTHADYVSPRNNIICPNCSGEGWVVSGTNTVLVSGTKKSLNFNDREDINAGQFKPGTIRVSTDLDGVAVSGVRTGETYFDQAIKVDYDGLEYEVVNVEKSGLGELYTCRVILERTNKG